MFYTSLVSFRHYNSILRQTFQPDPPPLTLKCFTRKNGVRQTKHQIGNHASPQQKEAGVERLAAPRTDL